MDKTPRELKNKMIRQYEALLPDYIDPNIKAIMDPIVSSIFESVGIMINQEINIEKTKNIGGKDKDKQQRGKQ